jgi:putative spermidine/putrescine transport system permease protein
MFMGAAGQKTLPGRCSRACASRSRPPILAAATVLIAISVLVLAALELLRRRNERMRGLSPS